MTLKEQLIKKIEEQRQVLNSLLKNESGAEEIYSQSLILDELIEQYMLVC